MHGRIRIRRAHPTDQSDAIETGTLRVSQVNEDGFGDPSNNYAWAMEPFKGALYVGTLNAKSTVDMVEFFWALPLQTNGVQIWKGTTDAEGEWTWRKVLEDGNGNLKNFGSFVSPLDLHVDFSNTMHNQHIVQKHAQFAKCAPSATTSTP